MARHFWLFAIGAMLCAQPTLAVERKSMFSCAGQFVSDLFGRKITPANFEWVGESMGVQEWQNFSSLHTELTAKLFKLRKQVVLEVLDFETKSNLVMSNQSLYTILTKATEVDQGLLQHSQWNTPDNIEVGMFEFRNYDRTCRGNVIFGNRYDIPRNSYERELKNTIRRCIQNGVIPYDDGQIRYSRDIELVFTHTHPLQEFRIHHRNGSLSQIVEFPLSEGDLRSGRDLSFSFPIPIRLRAVVPNGYVYETGFFNRGMRFRTN